MENGFNWFFSEVGPVNIAILLIIGACTLVGIRVMYVIYRSGKPLHRRPPGPLSALIVLGSGGHTAEMLNLLAVLQMDRFEPRYYIAAATDNMSLQKARVMEDSLKNKAEAEPVGTSHFMQIYRSREVGQSYITSVGTTLAALAHALWLMIKIRPQVILCNGPGTCIPLCAIAFVFKVCISLLDNFSFLMGAMAWFINSVIRSGYSNFTGKLKILVKVYRNFQVLGIRWSSIFYVESIARVRRLSLSGLLLYKLRMADQLFVQWPQLKTKYPRANYVGRLM